MNDKEKKMRRHLEYISILSFGLLMAVVPARAEDDVYVDLSVLNGLQQSASPAMSAPQPLFPVVHKKAPAVKTKPASRPRTVKDEVKKEQPEAALKTPEKTVVKTDAVKSPAPAAESKTVSPVEKTAEDTAEVYVPQADQKPETSPAPAAKQPAVASEILPQPAASQPLKPEAQVKASAQQTDEVETGLGLKSELITPAKNQVYAPEVPSSSDAAAPENAVSSADNQPAPAETSPAVSASVHFDGEESELTDADKKQIDAVIAGFQNPHDNKIAVTAYNVDGGANAFRRKRTSLNRAVNVRTYLLNQGYKNYSIKIVNVPENDERADTVEIKELF